MTIYYFNDRKINAIIQVDQKEGRTVLMPGEGRYFDVDVKEGQVPFIKVWENTSVLLCGIDLIASGNPS